MAIDTTAARSRRAVLTAAIGGLAAAAAASISRASPARAANGDPVTVGGYHKGTAVTIFDIDAATALAGYGNYRGVMGSSVNGSGLVGVSRAGYGLRVGSGRIQVEEVSGVATIKAGRKSVTVSPGVDINYRTFVLLTPMANIGSRGLWFTKDGTRDRFTIRMSSPRSRATRIAWLALERR